MRKIFSSFLVLLAVTMASTAFAGTITLGSTQAGAFPTVTGYTTPVPGAAQYFYPQEAAVGAPVANFNDGSLETGPYGVVTFPPLPTTNGKSILYKTSTNLPVGTRIVYTVRNGSFKNVTGGNDLFLIGAIRDIDGNITGVGSLGDLDNVSSPTTGVVEYTFVMSIAVAQNETLLISKTKLGQIATNPLVAVDANYFSLAPGNKVTIEVGTCATDGNHTINGCLTDTSTPTTLLESYKEFAWSMEAGDGEIDVPDHFRTAFVRHMTHRHDPLAPPSWETSDEPRHPGEVRLIDSPRRGFRIDLTLENVADLNYTITGGQFEKLESLDIDGSPSFNLTGVTSATTSVSASANSSDFSNSNWQDIIFELPWRHGAILDVQDFTLATALLFNGDDASWYLQTTTLEGPIMSWSMKGGWQGTLPYMFAPTNLTTSPLYHGTTDTFIKFFNNSVAESHIWVDVYPGTGGSVAVAGQTPSNPAVENVFMEGHSIPAGAVGTIWGSDVAIAANLSVGVNGTIFAAVFTADVKPESMTTIAIQKRGTDGDRVLSVYTGYSADYKHH